MTDNKILKMVYSAVFLALALYLPFLTAQIPQFGKMLCPMHIPVILCGFICGPVYGVAVGIISPLLRFAIFGMPVIYPSGVGMCFELATYALVAGILYKRLADKKSSIYISLLVAMLAGRLVWGAVRAIMFGVTGTEFGWQAFIAGAFLDAIPGIIIQIVLIPVVVMALKKNFARSAENAM